ncbi:MAG: hypothetical protein OJF55_002832 [Rhodanobacteraceae bacterium]|nr:MAG: hypothetical protein OJF55_002832 [Rhodanobacteraceae bacterium]
MDRRSAGPANVSGIACRRRTAGLGGGRRAMLYRYILELQECQQTTRRGARDRRNRPVRHSGAAAALRGGTRNPCCYSRTTRMDSGLHPR